MILTPTQVLQELERRHYRSIYFLQGEEHYYIECIVRHVEEQVLAPSAKDFNLRILYGKEQTLSTLLTHAQRYPVMSDRQVVVVKEAQDLQDIRKATGQKILANYLRSPHGATILVFVYRGKALDTKSTLGKLLAQYTAFVHAKKIYENQLSAWITSYVEAKGLTITPKASLMLQERVGNDLTQLAAELDKIHLRLQPATEIQDSTLADCVGFHRQFNVFELQQALARRHVSKAYQIVLYWRANPKDHPAIPVVALLSSFFSKVLLVHHASDTSQQILASRLRISPYFVQDYVLAAQHYALAKVVDNLHHLHEADLHLKGIDYPACTENEVLKELIFQLMQ
ncbi:MAG: DNA polymerase III subunit delta [Bacteroidota bacterium]